MTLRRKIPYGRQSIDEDDVAAVTAVLRGDWLTQGPAVARFEQDLAAYCGARHAVAVANGTVALHLACVAAGVKEGDEGITSPITFLASANALLYCGARPVFADIDARTWNLDPVEVARRVTPRTRVLIPVHFAGLPCDLAALRRIADDHGLTVVEDACHALGARYRGARVGSGPGHMACFSFHPVKHLTTGEGGAILTDDDELAGRLRELRHHGITKDPARMSRAEGGWYYEAHELGYNARITDIQCALGISQLRKLDGFLARRAEIAARYHRELAGVPGLSFQHVPAGSQHAYHLVVAHFDPSRHDRRSLYDTLHANGVGVQVHYVPVHRQPIIEQRAGVQGPLPNADHYYAGCLSLPVFPGLTESDQAYVIDTVKKACA